MSEAGVPSDTSEDRAKHRARLHLGENKGAGGQRRGGGFERSRGRGARRQPQQFYSVADRDGERPRPACPSGPSSPKPTRRLDDEPLNWADEVDREMERKAQQEEDHHRKAKSPSEEVTDLRLKLNAMRLNREGQTPQGDKHEFGGRNGDKSDKSDKSDFGGRHGDPPTSQNGHAGGGRRWQQNKGQHNGNGRQGVAGNLPRPKKNTENFDPSYDPPEMRILCAREGLSKYDRPCSTRDVIVVNGLFCEPDDYTLYKKILLELEQSGVTSHQLWQLWHGDSHVIADDKRKWKQECPTFMQIVDKIADYFDMDVKATRLNWYRDSSEWKPFHHDAAAVKADKAHTQNFTVAVSFGMERDAAFEHAKTKTIISMPQPNGTIYTFGRDVNILWRHGIPQIPPEKHSQEGRISIIAWGWIPQCEL